MSASKQFPHLPLAERATMTPLLAQRIKELDLVFPRGRPVYDRIFVYPVESKAQDEKFDGTSIIKPTLVQDKFNSARGVLIKAGPKALEQLWSHGIELGHVVLVARLSPWERKYEGKGRIHTVMVLRSSEVVSSEDLEDDVLDGHVSFEMEDGQVRIADRDRCDPDENDEGI